VKIDEEREGKGLVILDPELELDGAVASGLPEGDVLVFANPCQERVLAGLGRRAISAQFDARRVHERFNAVSLTLIEHSGDELLLRGFGGNEYSVSPSMFLETGHSLDLYVLLDDVFSNMQVFMKEYGFFYIVSSRGVFTVAVTASLGVRGLEVGRVIEGPVQHRAIKKPSKDTAAVLSAIKDMVLGWSKPKVLTLGHRQNLPVNERLRGSESVYMIDSFLFRAIGLLLGWFDHEPFMEREAFIVWLLGLKVRGDVWGAHLWRAFCDGQCDALMRQVEESRARCKALDVFNPAFILAPGWSGAELHVYRVWCAQNGRIFGAIQHGFQYGTRIAPRTMFIDADVFYVWGRSYVERWIDLEKNKTVELVVSGDPNGLQINGLSECARDEARKTILIAPSSCLEFSRGRYISFWEHMFELIDKRPEFIWSIRIHNLLRNDTWIMGEASKRGVVVETTSTRSLQDALERCDIVITSVSGMAVNAMQLRRAAVIVNITGEAEFFSEAIPNSVSSDYSKIELCIDDVLRDYENYVRGQSDFYSDLCKESDAAEEIALDVVARCLNPQI
jgi:hypothetical protein